MCKSLGSLPAGLAHLVSSRTEKDPRKKERKKERKRERERERKRERKKDRRKSINGPGKGFQGCYLASTFMSTQTLAFKYVTTLTCTYT